MKVNAPQFDLPLDDFALAGQEAIDGEARARELARAEEEAQRAREAQEKAQGELL